MKGWKKKGLLYAPAPGGPEWRRSHAQSPVADLGPDGELHLYFASRDCQNRSRVGRIQVDRNDPARVLAEPEQPVLDLGEPGMFDDSGVMPSCLVSRGREKLLFYTGWNRSVTVPYRLAIGVAVSHDGGKTFERVQRGPVLDRSRWSPGFCAAPFVWEAGGSWEMCYVSCTHWKEVLGRPEPFYHLKRAVSEDALQWEETGEVCVDYDERTDAVSRPCVYAAGSGLEMLYAYRKADAYRERRERSYRLGRAIARDGRTWVRDDDGVCLPISEEGWDSGMIAYPFLHRGNGRDVLFYNGNDFGRTGIGYAFAEVDE